MKRLLIGALWVFSVWYLVNGIAFFVGVPDLLGPVVGAAAGLFVMVDPKRIFWTSKALAQA